MYSLPCSSYSNHQFSFADEPTFDIARHIHIHYKEWRYFSSLSGKIYSPKHTYTWCPSLNSNVVTITNDYCPRNLFTLSSFYFYHIRSVYYTTNEGLDQKCIKFVSFWRRIGGYNKHPFDQKKKKKQKRPETKKSGAWHIACACQHVL